MNISRIFIERPVMTTLAMVALVIFGVFGYVSLPISNLPNVDFPTIQVQARLPGADPTTMASSVAEVLENQFSTIAGIDSMTSQSVQGQTNISIQFVLDRNIDAAAQDVQAAMAAAARWLPKSMQQPPWLTKVNPADQPIMFLTMYSDSVSRQQVDEYGETMLARQLSTIEGVAEIDVFGQGKYAVRVQLDPDALAARQIGIDAVSNAVANANVNQPTGALNGERRSFAVHANGQLNNAGEFGQQIVAYRDGAPIRLRDVATVIDGFENPYGGNWYNNHRATTLTVHRQPGSNTVGIINAIKQILPRFEAGLPRAVHLIVVYDQSVSIENSINDVQMTLLVSGILVVGVIFVFLRRVSATLIPSLALPIAVIATFAGMAAMEYNLDNLSLMALTLSVGFVVDDAIVMLENIVRHIEMGEKPYQAALKGSSEVGFTILSMTISLAAVFIPVVFMGGIVGRLLHEFAVTIILAILFSGIISVTLTPMLCARLLRDEHHHAHNAFYRWSENAFNRMQDGYARSLDWALGHGRFIFGIFLLSIVASVALFEAMPQDFLPPDDTGRLQGQIQVANGTSYEQLYRYMAQVSDIFNSDPNVSASFIQMYGGDGTAGQNSANMNVVPLKPLGERKLSADEVLRELRPKFAHLPGVNVFLNNPPLIQIGARQTRSNYQYTLQGLDLGQLQVVSDALMNQLHKTPGFIDLSSDLDAAMPSVEVAIDRDRAASLNVSAAQIETALGEAFNGQQISQINTSANQYAVIVELQPKFLGQATALRRLYLTSDTGALVPLSAVAKITTGTQPLSVNHSGEMPSVTISFNLAQGYALSDAVSAIRKASDEIGIPDDVSGNFQGTAAAFQSSTQNMGMLLFVAMVVVYIVLGILYESFIHPLTILSGLPSAAVGALLTLYIAGLPLTLYAFVGMIMLVGIVKKNAIMMIDFALARQRSDGIAPRQAIHEAAITRFRPIMMTTAAALMGTLPIALGFGAGAESRRPLGLCVVGGLMLSQLLTLYITPVIYTYLDRFGTAISVRRAGGRPAPQPAE